MIGICTDSNGQLPRQLIDRYRIEVVPLTVSVDGAEFLEGVNLDADGFYDLFSDDRHPLVTTAAPSPARFVAAYRRLAERGATAVLSVHLGSELSGTLNSARLAARDVPVPVRFVDTHAASFIVGCATWEAAGAVSRGASLEEAAAVAESVASACGNIFTTGTLALARAGGRMAGESTDAVAVPVLRLAEGKIEVIGDAATTEHAAAIMAEAVLGAGRALRVGVGDSDVSSVPVADELCRRLEAAGHDHEIVRYRVGPSVGAHTGPGTAGVVFYETLGRATA